MSAPSCTRALKSPVDTKRSPVVLKLGTLGAGNHYAEIQVVDEIYNDYAAKKMGIDHKGQVCVMIHSGSRGLGHQVATGRTFPRNTRTVQEVRGSFLPP